MSDDTYEDEDTYCYYCGHEHMEPSHGSWPEQYCDGYEEYTTEGESK